MMRLSSWSVSGRRSAWLPSGWLWSLREPHGWCSRASAVALRRGGPGRAAAAARARTACPGSHGSVRGGGEPREQRPDLALIEDGPFGPLPRIAPDGRRPFLAYARPFNLEDSRPKVAVLILGLGLERELFDAALALPGPIGLQLSPYAPDLPALVERARGAGHEVLLELSMESADYPASDPGPHTLLAAGATRT